MFSLMSGFELARVGKFGFGCNRHEHVLYGMCLDGKCCRRGYSEKVLKLQKTISLSIIDTLDCL